MRMALKKHAPSVGIITRYELADWAKLEADSRGAQPSAIDRQLKQVQCTPGRNEPSLVEEPELNGELRKAALYWSVYRFPVKHVPTADQVRRLNLMPQWQELNAAQKFEVKMNLFATYNDEERAWGRSALNTASRPDIRSRPNTSPAA